MFTDMRFWLGVAAGAALVAFVLPWARGTMAAKQGG